MAKCDWDYYPTENRRVMRKSFGSTYNWVRFDEFEHVILVKENNIDLSDLSEEINEKIQEFNQLFSRVLRDGIVDESEREEVMSFSKRIATMIVEYYRQKELKEERQTTGLGILATIALIAGTAIGIRQLTK